MGLNSLGKALIFGILLWGALVFPVEANWKPYEPLIPSCQGVLNCPLVWFEHLKDIFLYLILFIFLVALALTALTLIRAFIQLITLRLPSAFRSIIKALFVFLVLIGGFWLLKTQTNVLSGKSFSDFWTPFWDDTSEVAGAIKAYADEGKLEQKPSLFQRIGLRGQGKDPLPPLTGLSYEAGMRELMKLAQTEDEEVVYLFVDYGDGTKDKWIPFIRGIKRTGGCRFEFTFGGLGQLVTPIGSPRNIHLIHTHPKVCGGLEIPPSISDIEHAILIEYGWFPFLANVLIFEAVDSVGWWEYDVSGIAANTMVREDAEKLVQQIIKLEEGFRAARSEEERKQITNMLLAIYRSLGVMITRTIPI